MIAPELLLRMPPKEAVRAMMVEKLKSPLKSHHLRIGKPVSLGGVRTSIEATIDKSVAPVELWDRKHTFTFEYSRLDLNAFTSGLDKTLITILPSQSDELLSGILSPFQIPVMKDDTTPATFLTYGSIDLLAADESYRWVGAVSVRVNMQVLDITNMLLVKNFSIPFDSDFKSNTVKERLAMFISMANASVLHPAIKGSMFTLSAPEVNGAEAEPDNTKLTLTFNGSPYMGSVDIVYPRRSFPDTFRWPIACSGGQLGDKRELYSQLSVQMKCEIVPADINSETFPTVQIGNEVNVNVNFRSTSLAYIGSVLVKYRRTS